MPASFEQRRFVKSLVSEISQRCEGDPVLTERTQQFLKGELPTLRAQKPVTVRLSDPLIERLDSLAEALNADPDMALSGPWTRSTTLREAVIRGIGVLEKELRKPGKKQEEAYP